MTWELPAHPEWVAGINRMGANVGTADALVDLSEESLIAAAIDATGGLDHLPADTPAFSPDDRRAQIEQRRRGIARRFRR